MCRLSLCSVVLPQCQGLNPLIANRRPPRVKTATTTTSWRRPCSSRSLAAAYPHRLIWARVSHPRLSRRAALLCRHPRAWPASRDCSSRSKYSGPRCSSLRLITAAGSTSRTVRRKKSTQIMKRLLNGTNRLLSWWGLISIQMPRSISCLRLSSWLVPSKTTSSMANS